jgi:hypothetical protein
MYLIEILLPLYDNEGRRLPQKLFDHTSRSLAKSHGGVTAYTRSPAVGLWKPRASQLRKDEIIVYEVVTPDLKPKLWKNRRKKWEMEFRQDSILIRVTRCQQL